MIGISKRVVNKRVRCRASYSNLILTKKGDNMRKIKWMLVCSVFVVSLMACHQVKDSSSSNLKPTNSENQISSLETPSQQVKQTRLAVETILQLTEQQMQGRVLEIEYEEGFPPYYQVTLISDGVGYELDFNAENGDLLNKRSTLDEVQHLENVQLSISEVIAVAKGKIEGAEVISVQLENEGSGMMYQVELEHNGIDYDVKIDANDGSVIELES